MIWVLGLAVLLIVGGRYIRPSRLGKDAIWLEVFRHLRYRNAADAQQNMSYDDLKRRLWTQVSVLSFIVFASLTLSARALGGTWTISALSSSACLASLLAAWRKKSQSYRHITLPLYATLCRMQGSRWDMRAVPRKWVRLKGNKLWIQLPKDWHAHKRQLEVVRDLVNTRVPGYWKMEADTQKFLLTFTRESEPEIVIPTEPDFVEPDFMERAEFVQHMTDAVEEQDLEKPW